ncbi:hypothetical protein FR965_17685 [Serratia marcescens]|nr:hypothetical protein FR965_17685 [Serratia marcescens]
MALSHVMLYHNSNYAPTWHRDQAQIAYKSELMRTVCIKQLKQKKKAACAAFSIIGWSSHH